MASLIAAGTSYATHGEPMIPFYIFYSMFGFQRTGDQAWAFGDQRGRGFMIGATAGRTTLAGEGLQHDDGHSHILASTVPVMRAYDPAFAYELAAVIRDGVERMYHRRRGRLLLRHRLQRELRPAGEARGRRRGHRPRHLPLRRRARHRGPEGSRPARRLGLDPPAGDRRPRPARRASSGSPRRSTRRPRSSSSATRRSRSSAGTGSTPTRARGCRTSARCWAPTAARSSWRRTGSGPCRTSSRRGCRTPTSCSARTASGAATRARTCGRTSRSTRRTSRRPRWPASRAAASIDARQAAKSIRALGLDPDSADPLTR